MISRIRLSGQVGIWVGTARVRHFLPASRLTLRYVQEWYRGAGRTEIRLKGLDGCPTIFDMPRWAVVKYSRAQLESLCLSPYRGKRWWAAFREASILDGFLREAREQRRAGFCKGNGVPGEVSNS